MDLQRRDKNRKQGGAGDRRIEWEVDEAALIEAGGDEGGQSFLFYFRFRSDWVGSLQVLGFTERMVTPEASRPTSAYTASTEEVSYNPNITRTPPPIIKTTTPIPHDFQGNVSSTKNPDRSIELDYGEEDAPVLEEQGPFFDEIDEKNSNPSNSDLIIDNSIKKRKPPPPPPSRRQKIVRKISNLTVSSKNSGTSDDMEMETSNGNGNGRERIGSLSDFTSINRRSRSSSDPFIDQGLEADVGGGRRRRSQSLLGREMTYRDEVGFEEEEEVYEDEILQPTVVIAEDDQEMEIEDEDSSLPRSSAGLLDPNRIHNSGSLTPVSRIEQDEVNQSTVQLTRDMEVSRQRPKIVNTNSSSSVPILVRTRLSERF
jgi:hypothetical protein